jgi:hypothetical protein
MKTTSMMRAGVINASGAHGKLRFFGCSGSGRDSGDGTGGADASAGIVVMANLLSRIVSSPVRAWNGVPRGTEHPVQ